MNDTLLAIVAVATAIIAVTQLLVCLVIVKLARRVDEVSGQIQKEIGPLAERLRHVADNVQQATSLAVVQVERVDRLLSSAARRAEETMSVVQGVIVGPMREGLALVSALRSVIQAIRGFRSGGGGRGAGRFDDEDPLFIG